MKKIIALIFLFVSVNVSAQNNAAEDTTVKPAITAIGKPDGEKAEMKIGKEGGSFTSSDGKIRLIIPEGAVSKKTSFSIQPTANLAPNGNGKAYRMEPSGVNFQKPLQIIFHYADGELEGNSPSLLGIAMQDDKGQWFSVNKAITDTVAKTLTADIKHFSAYVNYMHSRIDPTSAKVKVNGSLRLKIITFTPLDEFGDDEFLTALGTNEIIYTDAWSVNGIPGGNSTVGLISASQNKSAIFQAPAQVPAQNPVAVTVQQGFSISSKKNYGKEKLVSNITIYGDAYEVKMQAMLKGGSSASWGGIVTYRDEGSFIVSLDNNRHVL